jgi:hypothetical protein
MFLHKLGHSRFGSYKRPGGVTNSGRKVEDRDW